MISAVCGVQLSLFFMLRILRNVWDGSGMREVCQGSSPSLSSRSAAASAPASAPAHPNIYITPGLAWPSLFPATTTGPRDTGLTDHLVKTGPRYQRLFSPAINKTSPNVTLML